MELKLAMYDFGVERMRRTNVLTKCLFGRYKPYNPGTPYTTQVTMELETSFNAIRLYIPNIHTAAVTGVKVSVAVTNGDSSAEYQTNPNPSTGEWVEATQNGASSFTLAPQLGPERVSFTPSDILNIRSIARLTPGARPLLVIRIEYPSGQPCTVPYNNVYYWRISASSARQVRASGQAVLGVTTKTDYTTNATIDERPVIPAVQYMADRQGQQILISGDSTSEGLGNTVRCFGSTQIAAYSLSTQDKPIEYANLAIHSQVPTVYSQVIRDHASWIRPTMVFYQPYSINDVAVGGMIPANQTRMYGCLGATMAYLHDAGLKPWYFLMEAPPTNTAYRNIGAGDQIRRDAHAYFGTVTGAIAVKGYADAMTGVRTNGQDQFKTGMVDPDNAHPNTAGYQAGAEVVKTYMRAVMDMAA